MDGQPAWSMAEARNWAAPAGVRSTTRFALASADRSSSGPTRASTPDAPSSARALSQAPGQLPLGPAEAAGSDGAARPDEAAGPGGTVRPDEMGETGEPSPGGPGSPPGREPGPPGSPGSAYTSVPPAPRSRTAPSSSRSRERVAWATLTPR